MNAERGKRPSVQWYPGDHRRDIGVQTCSFDARALWREMLDFMHDGEPYGHLTAAGVPIDDALLADMVRLPVARVRKLIAELELKKVFSRTTDQGVIYSRRMVRDDHNRRVKQQNGRLGGNPSLLDKAPVKAVDNLTDNPSVAGAVAVAVASTTSTSKTAAEVRRSFPRVAAALDDPRHPGLFEAFHAQVFADVQAYFGRAERALGMGAPGLGQTELADVVAEYVSNLTTGSEHAVNVSRFEAYLQRRKGRDRGSSGQPRRKSAPSELAVLVADLAARHALTSRSDADSWQRRFAEALKDPRAIAIGVDRVRAAIVEAKVYELGDVPAQWLPKQIGERLTGTAA